MVINAGCFLPNALASELHLLRPLTKTRAAAYALLCLEWIPRVGVHPPLSQLWTHLEAVLLHLLALRSLPSYPN